MFNESNVLAYMHLISEDDMKELKAGTALGLQGGNVAIVHSVGEEEVQIDFNHKVNDGNGRIL